MIGFVTHRNEDGTHYFVYDMGVLSFTQEKETATLFGPYQASTVMRLPEAKDLHQVKYIAWLVA